MRSLEGTKERDERLGDGQINTTTDCYEPLEDGRHPFLAASLLLSKKGQHDSEKMKVVRDALALIFRVPAIIDRLIWP
jgi:hypothetical protein